MILFHRVRLRVARSESAVASVLHGIPGEFADTQIQIRCADTYISICTQTDGYVPLSAASQPVCPADEAPPPHGDPC